MFRLTKRSKRHGFALSQVMVAVAVMGIVATIYSRQTSNRSRAEGITGMLAYRDQALNYYTSMASNRVSWRNSRPLNWSSLSNGTSYETKDVDNSSRIPATGLMLTAEEISKGNVLPSPIKNCSATETNYHFCLKSIKKGNNTIEIKIEFVRPSGSDENFDISPQSRELTFAGTDVGSDCSPKAVVDLDFEGNPQSVTCSNRGPLIEPPKWDLLSTDTKRGKCGTNSSGGELAVRGFDKVTGKTLCGNDRTLVKVSSLNNLGSYQTGISWLLNNGSVRRHTANYIAVEPYSCNQPDYAIRGWNNDGSKIGCLQFKRGPEGRQGLKGLKGNRGDTGNPGIQGRRGLRGPRGNTGISGPPGANGSKGQTGDRGETGEQGTSGYAGSTGSDLCCCDSCN